MMTNQASRAFSPGKFLLFLLATCWVMMGAAAQEAQTITWLSPTNAALRLDTPYELSASASSGLPVSFRVVVGPATLEGSQLTVTGIGPVTIATDQAGDATYLPASSTNRFNVGMEYTTQRVGKYDGPIRDFQVVGKRAYVADAIGLQILDVSNPANPVRLGGYTASGAASRIRVAGNVAYMIDPTKGVDLIDVSNPATPALLSHYSGRGARSVAVVGSLAYFCDRVGLDIVDVSNPATPVHVGSYPEGDSGPGAFTVLVAETTAYITHPNQDFYPGVQVLDLTDPAKPVHLGTYVRDPRGSGLTPVNSANPMRRGTYATSGPGLALSETGKFLYAAMDDIGLHILDVGDPTKPALAGIYDSSRRAKSVQAEGSSAYLAEGRLNILDLSDPLNPMPKGYHYSTAFITSAQVVGSTAYLNDGNLLIVKLSQGTPQTISFSAPDSIQYTNVPLSLTATASSQLPVSLKIVSGAAKITNNLVLLTGVGDVVVRAEQPGEVPFLPAPAVERTIHVLPNQTIFFTAPESLEFTNAPLHLTATASSDLPVSFKVASGNARISSGQVVLTGLGDVVIRAEQPGNGLYSPAIPVERTIHVLPNHEIHWVAPADARLRPNIPYGLQAVASSGLPVKYTIKRGPAVIDGDLMTLSTAGVVTVSAEAGDATYPRVSEAREFNSGAVYTLTKVGDYAAAPDAIDVQVAGNRAYVVSWTAGLQILDISTPTNAAPLGNFPTGDQGRAVQVIGNLAYIADGNAGLQILDVSDPRNPVRLGGFTVEGGFARGVKVVGSLAYIAGSGSGLWILDVSDPANPKVVKILATGISTQDVEVVGTQAFIANNNGFVILDVVNPAQPTIVGSLPGANYTGVQVAGDWAYVTVSNREGIQLLDLRDPTKPTYCCGDDYGAGISIEKVGNTAYAAFGSLGVRVIELHTGGGFRFLATYDTAGTAFAVSVAGPLIYVADGSRGLQVLQGRAGFTQTLGFEPPTSLYFTNGPLNLGATASSGLPVTFRVLGGPAEVRDDQLFLTGIGRVNLRAEQAGDDLFFPAASVERSFEVAPNQTIQFTVPASMPFTNAPLVLDAHASSGLPVTFQVLSGPAEVRGDDVFLTGNGRVTLRAKQPGGAVFSPAAAVERSFEVVPNQSITWVSPTDPVLLLNTPYELSAVANSGLPVTFRVLGGSANVQGNRLTISAVERVVVVAEQPGNDMFSAASTTRVFNSSFNMLTTEVGKVTQINAKAIQVAGTRGYVAAGAAGLQIFDLTNPRQPVWLGGQAAGVQTSASALQVVGDKAYLVDGAKGLRIIDVSNPTNLVLLGNFKTDPSSPAAVQVRGNLAYLADLTAGLQVVDVSNPVTPTRLARIPGSYREIQIFDHFAYLLSFSSLGFSKLEIFDISEPATPVLRLVLPLSNSANLRIKDGFAYLTKDPDLRIFDLDNPEEPVEVGRHHIDFLPTALEVADSIAYLAVSTGVLEVLDVSDPHNPRLMTLTGTEGRAQGLAVAGALLYAASDNGDLQVLEFQRGFPQEIYFQPPGLMQFTNAPIDLGATSSSGLPVRYRVAEGPARIVDNRLELTNVGAVVIDAYQPGIEPYFPAPEVRRVIQIQPNQELTWVSAVDDPLRLNSIHELQVTASSGLPVTYRVLGGPGQIEGNRLTITGLAPVAVMAEQAGNTAFVPVTSIRRFNASLTPAKQRLGFYATNSQSMDVQVVGSLAYVAEDRLGLQILDVSDPAKPVRVGGYPTTSFASAVQVVGNLAYLAGGTNGLQILDVSSPTNVVLVGSYKTQGLPLGLRVSGNLAFVADTGDGIHIVNVSDPANPVRLGGYPSGPYTRTVDLAGDRAYVAAGFNGLMILDVSNPSTPLRLGTIEGNATDVQIVGSLAYVASSNPSLRIFDVSDAANPVFVGWHGPAGNGLNVHVNGSLAYVSTESQGVQIVDVSLPADPHSLGLYQVSTAQPHAMKTVGKLAYIAYGTAGLQIVDLSLGFAQSVSFTLPASQVITNAPLELTATASSGLPVSYEIVSGSANVTEGKLVATGVGPVVVRAEQPGDDSYLPAPTVDRTIEILSNQSVTWQAPTLPLLRTHVVHTLIATASSGLPVTYRLLQGPAVVDGDVLVVTNAGVVAVVAEQLGNGTYWPAKATNQFNLNPGTTVARRGGVDTSGIAQGVDAVGNLAYLADGAAGLQIFDCRNPATPVRVGEYRTTGARAVQVVGSLAYVADAAAGLQIIDVSDPAKPLLVGRFDTAGTALDVRVAGTIAYVADGAAGLQILDVSDPGNTKRIGNYPGSASTLTAAVEVVGSLAYVAVRGLGLQILDISQPSAPIRLGAKNVVDGFNDVQIQGNLAFVAQQTRGLYVYDVTNPSNIVQVGSYLGTGAWSVRIAGSRAIMGASTGAVLLNLSNPAQPVLLGNVSVGSLVYGSQIFGTRAYLAAGTTGLHVVELKEGYPQSLTFTLPARLEFTHLPINLNATTTAGLPATYRVASGPGRIVDNALVLEGIGRLVLQADQLGDDFYLPAATTEARTTVVVGPPLLSAPAPVANGDMRLEIRGTPGSNVTLRWISNLGGPWQPLTNLTLGTEASVVFDPAQESSTRFYQAILTP